MGAYERSIRPLLFRLDPERAHRCALAALRGASALPGGRTVLRRALGAPVDGRLAVEVAGLTFPNPLGLAAGMDKDAVAVAGWFALGFGSVEVGTVTPCPQPGNPRPRLWRFPEAEALVNALGFPSAGAAAVRARLAGRSFPGPVGVNLGKNAATPLERAAYDYCAVLAALWDVADYMVVNVSSPNTPGLRTLQAPEQLERILERLATLDRTAARVHGAPERPLFVKISLDIEPVVLDELVVLSASAGVAGLIIGNTSTDPALRPRGAETLPGGVSGGPLRQRAIALLARAAERAPAGFALVSAGGAMRADDVIERIRLGAHLVQCYTGLVYRGPGFAAAVLRELLRCLEERGLPSVQALRGR
ncbi:MAG: quinone-dependent dihydroorotate dehydrogenase [Thermomicrobium sp.]|nr:quinone-dependent dihydroorotate dehydrogenase [Thermomicrobium sp.]MDW8060543.1 quinone-dependent dihydroorotate dehydrogenase [Thermomicrobium sp.]